MSVAGFDPNRAENHQDIEKQMAVKCVEHAQTYWNLLEKLDPSTLRLTKLDDEILSTLSEKFPEYFGEDKIKEGVKKIDEDQMKSEEGKKKWRSWMESWEGKISDFNMGTLIRIDGSDEYTQHNTTFVPRMQFYAFEIARNRHGINDWVRAAAAAEAEKEKAEKEKEAKKKGGKK